MHTICTTYSSVHAVCVQYMQCVCSTCNVCAVCMQYLCMQSLCRQCFSSSTLTLPPLFTHTTQHTLPRQELCPAGRYGSVEGLTDRGCSRTGVGNVALGDSGGTLEPGGVGYSAGCVGEVHGVGGGGLVMHAMMGGSSGTNSDGDLTSTTTQCGNNAVAFCHPGYWCPPGSTTPTQRRCGNASVYCPVGSGAPTLAPPGYYTVLGLPVTGEHRLSRGGDGNGVHGDGRRKGGQDMGGTSVQEAQTRSDIDLCPLGHWCR